MKEKKSVKPTQGSLAPEGQIYPMSKPRKKTRYGGQSLAPEGEISGEQERTFKDKRYN